MTTAFDKLITDDNYRSILCLNGELPAKSFFARGLPIIAADGAANTLAAMDIQPDFIIGDLDSAHASIMDKSICLHDENQETNDYQKSLTYIKQNHLFPSIVVGVSGGYLDHILNNINIFMNSNCLLYAPPIIGRVLSAQQTYSLSVPVNTKISLIGLPAATLSSSGLKWELDEHLLTFPGNNSCFNRTSKNYIELNVHDGHILMLIYLDDIHDAGLR